MDDVSISGTIQGMYNGLAQQQDAYGRARFYNSIASQNQYNLGEQQLEAQKNRDFGNMLQRNMTSTPAAQPMSSTQPQAQAPMASQTQTQTQPQQNGLPPLSPSYLRNLPNTGMMGLSQMGSGQPQASAQQQSQQQSVPQSSDERQQMIRAYQQSTTPSAQQSTTPSAPANPLKIAGLQAQGQTPTLTPLADHSAVQGFLATTPNAHPDTVRATDKDNPTFASQHVFDAVDPQSGAVVHNTFDRQGLINQMMNYTDRNGNHTMAADANKLMASFTLSDAADEKTKQDAIVAANGKALMLSAGLEYLPADQQAAVYQSLKSRAAQAGADVTTWPTGPTDPNFKPWVAQQGEEARMNANTAQEASKRAEDAFNDLKARAEAGKDQAQGQEAQAKAETDQSQARYLGAEAKTQPSVRNKNNAEAFRAYQEGLKAQQTPISPLNGTTEETADVPPKLVAPATSAFEKSTQTLAKATSAQAGLNDFISAAKGGNVIASAYTPTEAVLAINTAAGVKRVNMNEINSMSSAGSIFQRIQGKLTGLATGDKVPDSILSDLQQVADSMGQTASSQHQNEIKGINATYHSNFKPINFGANSSMPAGIAVGMIPRKSDGSVLKDGKYPGYSVVNGKVAP